MLRHILEDALSLVAIGLFVSMVLGWAAILGH